MSFNSIGKSQPGSTVDSYENIDKFVNANDPFVWDRMLSGGEVSGVDVKDYYHYDYTALMYSSCRRDGKSSDKLSYLLTYKPPADVNNKGSYDRRTPLHCAASNNNIESIEIMIDVNGDRSLTNNYNQNPLQFINERNKKEAAKMLEEYFPTEE